MTASIPSRLNTTRTGQAALACIETLLAAKREPGSPLFTVMEIANTLELDRRVANQAWVIRNHGEAGPTTRISAWPLWFSRDRSEKPLLYLHSASSSAQLCALAAEATRRGILCNASETLTSPWPKGAEPSLPLWLASNPECLPFDPASGDEARAIVLEALQALYVEGRPGFYYLALHDRHNGPALDEQQRRAALKGMYQVARYGPADSTCQVRLLGAGQAFAEVREAALLLAEEWGVAVQLWSCPSYTRLAREAASAERWNRLHPCLDKRDSHLLRCLGDSRAPVLAVTGYGQSVADQLRRFVQSSFSAIGADSLGGSTDPRRGAAPQRHWISVLALKALADEQRLPQVTVEQALQRYRLG